MLLTLKQASQVTGYSIDTLRSKIKDGSISTVMIKNRYMIEEKDLAAHIKKVAKSRGYEQSHAEREVPQDIPFSPERLREEIRRIEAETERDRVAAVHKTIDFLNNLLHPAEQSQILTSMR